jgi:putative transcriptional regulator
MSGLQTTESLDGKLLVAMPGMSDPRFEFSVIFLCSHSEEGAMGLIVNKPAEDLRFSDLLDQLEIPRPAPGRDIRVHVGGPCEYGRGFVLHSADYASNSSTMQGGAEYGMTATLDILKDISEGQGPNSCLLAMGYAGWGPGQLESEIVRNGWLTCDASAELVFSSDLGAKWSGALASMGIDPLMLSAEGGRA